MNLCTLNSTRNNSQFITAMCDEQSLYRQEVFTKSTEDFCTSSRRSDESLNLENSIEEYTSFLPSIYTYRGKNGKTKTSSFERGWTPVEGGVTLTWKDVNVYVQGEKKWSLGGAVVPPFKRVLNNVFGAIQPGSLVAMMGASGAGKSTLMSVLAHRAPKGVMVDGEIRVNGRQVGPSMRDLSGFVYQDDLFVGSLTCREHLEFMAELRLGKNVSGHARKEIIDRLISELSLGNCENTQIGGEGFEKGISGGEMKRLAFASEVLTDPPVLFCDEPTTGLDSFSAETLVKIMKKMAAEGKTIVCTIHQPSSEIYNLFGSLILLTEGRIAYMGTTKRVLSFFESFGYKCPENYNPADFFVQTLAVVPGHEQHCRSTIKATCDRFAVSSQAREIELLIQYEANVGYSMEDAQLVNSTLESQIVSNRAGWWNQTRQLAKRSFIDSLRNPAVHWLRIAQKFLPGFILEPIIFTTVAYWIMGLRNSAPAFLYSVLVIILTANTASACGMFFSAAFESLSMASAILIPFDYILMITGGIFINIKTLPLYAAWTSYFSWFFYTNEALNIVQWEGVENISCDATTPSMTAICVATGEEVLKKYSFNPSYYPIDILAMLLLYFGFHLFGFLALLKRVRLN
ncbi:protein scarlet-like isoform X3 [Artemia franciscana]|uniref:protein scarlet-like isoform X3 n=1 Tax=Artemia franciscana TaxID=6661 RepID=UPI0032DAB480